MELPDLIGWLALAITVGAVVFRSGYRLGADNEALRIRERERANEAAFYFRGLNFLLTDEPDKAIEEFIKVVRINSDTVEIHLSLGNLFRARGEVGRAIRIHQNIIARPDLSTENRTDALFALAEDYRQGGFLDRSVEAYRRVLEVDPDHRKALAGLQILHESEGRWDLALEVLQRLRRVTSQPDPRREAHLIIRGGLAPAGEDGYSASLEALQTAIDVFPGCVEAYRQLGEHQLATGKTRSAIKSFSAVKKNRPSHFFLLVNVLRKAYERVGDEKGFEKCMAEAVGAPTAPARLLTRWSQLLEEQERLEEAEQVLRKGMAQYPASAAVAHQLILLLSRMDKWPEAVSVAVAFLDQLTSRQPVFQCAQCGFRSQDIYWKCPQCLQWDTLEPL